MGEKKIMLGNEAIARGAYEAGVKVSSAYPGTPSTEISENIVNYDGIYAEWSPNEKVAMEVAIGASMAGVRALCSMKMVGVNVASDPLYTISYSGVNGGLVLVAADDPGLYSSQNEQDSRCVARVAQVPVLEPSDSGEAKEFTKLAFELSEKYDCPIMLRTTTRLAHSQGVVELEDRMDVADKEYTRDIAKYVMMPANAKKRHVVVEKRLKDMAEDACSMPINKVEYNDKKIGVITSGIPYLYVKEAMPTASVLKLGLVHPLPKKLIEEFAANVDELYIIEELEPLIEEQVKSWGIKCHGKDILTVQGEYSANMLRKAILGMEVKTDEPADVPARPPILCPGCPHRSTFSVLNELGIHGAGDIGCYTLGALPPMQAVDTVICMGASVGMAHGFDKATDGEASRNTVGVIGDSTFLHSGITNLMNAVYNGSTMTLIILDNSITGMTGHQQNPATGMNIRLEAAPAVSLEMLCQSVGVMPEAIRVVDPVDTFGCQQVIKEEMAREAVSVVIARRPCALIPTGRAKKGVEVHVDLEKCKKCGACGKIMCPALIMSKDKTPMIDPETCNNCGLCVNVCKFNALEKGEE